MSDLFGQKSREMLKEEQENYAPAGRIPYYDIVLERGEGALLYDVDGKEYIDLLASASATNVGHCHPYVVKAIQEQSSKLVHYTPAYFAQAAEIELVGKLAEIAPGPTQKKIIFGTSGSDANDAIIKFARAYTGRQNIISFIGAYHGSTYGSMTLSAISLNMRRKMGPLVPGIYHAPYPNPQDPRVAGMSEEEMSDFFMSFIHEMADSYLPADEVAAIVIEPIAGDLGLIVPPAQFMTKLYDWCQENGVLFTVDEINQGMGRTGSWWSIEHFGIEPDLMSVGKSLASGMPLSAIVGKAEIMDALGYPAHLFTNSGNPVCCAASLATIKALEEGNLLERSRTAGEHAKKRFEEMSEKYSIIGEVHGKGLNLGIDVIDPDTGEKDARRALKIIYTAAANGVLMITIATSVLRFQPPLVITDEQLDKALDILDEAIAAVEAGKVDDSVVPQGRGW